MKKSGVGTRGCGIVVGVRALAVVLAVLTVGGSLLVVVPIVRAPLTGLAVTPGLYTGAYVYVPGETITFMITGDTAGEVYDAVVAKVSTAQMLAVYNDVAIPTGLSLTMTYTVPANLPDNAVGDYRIEIGNQNYIESGRVGLLLSRRFSVQAYDLTIEVNLPAYLGGDSVIVTWSARNLKDGSLAPAGYGRLWVNERTGPGASLISPSPYVFPGGAPSGSFMFRLPDLADPRWDGEVMAWFNDSASNPIRAQQAFDFFDVNALGVIVDVTPTTNIPGGIVTTDVLTVNTNNPSAPSPTDPPEPSMNVDITVWEVPPPPGTPTERTQYAAQNLITDSHGELSYVFQLDQSIPDGTDFEVRANATHPNGIWQSEGRASFAVSSTAALTMVLLFNQVDYQAGDSATATAVVSGAGGAPLTYTFEVRDTTNAFCTIAIAAGTLLAADTRSSNQYTYSIPPNFAGQICFRAFADDGQGNRVGTAEELSVVFGWLTLSADREEYEAGDTITVTWTLSGNRILNPNYFYEVRDAVGNRVESGTTDTARSFGWVVPSVPSAMYTIVVVANENGRTVEGSLTVRKVAGFFLDLAFDPTSSYVPGGVILFHYALVPRAPDVPYPPTFLLEYGLANAPPSTLTTTSSAGDVPYTVPLGIDEGPQLFAILELNTNTQAIEVLTIDGSDPVVGAPFAGPAATGAPVQVSVNASDNVGLASVRMHWSYTDGSNGTLSMAESPAGTYNAAIPARTGPGTLDVYVLAEDAAGNTARSPTVRITVASDAGTDGTGGNQQAASLTMVDLAVIAIAIVALVVSALSLIRRRGGGKAQEEEAPQPPSA